MQVKEFKHVLGIDISKQSLELCLISGHEVLVRLTVANTKGQLTASIKKMLSKQGLQASEMLCCAEHTGMYSYPLIQVNRELGIPLWLENGAAIKLSSGINRDKNDKADAFRIARYAVRFMDKLMVYTSGNETLEKLACLNSERELLQKDKGKYTAQLKDQKDFMHPQAYEAKAQRLQKLVNYLASSIQEIEQQMLELIDGDPQIKQQFIILISICGVGKQVAINTIISTQAFQRFTNPRKFCCHVGVAPFSQQSGSSLQSRNRVSHRANKRLKVLFHLAALSAIKAKGELNDYYLRKVAEGKNKMTVINAVRAKIIHRIFALIRDNRSFEKNYFPNLVLS